MKRVHPETAYEHWKWFKVQKIYRRDSYKPRTFNEPEYAVAAYMYYPDYDLYGWTYVWLGMNDEPTTYDTAEEAKQFMEWIKAWCNTEAKVEDIEET